MSQVETQASNFKKYFFEQYPHYSSDKGGDAIKFTAEDSEYRIYKPHVKANSSGTRWEIDVDMDHIRGGDTDDHCTIKLYFQQDGAYTQAPTADIKFSGDNWSGAVAFTGQVVDVVLEVTNGVEEVVSGGLGIIFAPETVGGSVALAVATDVITLAVSTAIDMSFQLGGKLASHLEKLTDDGGRAYFTNVVAHAITRLQTAFLEAAHGKKATSLGFDFGNFKKAITVSNQSAKNGNAVEYRTAGDDYRTWKQDFTVSYGNQSMMISGKVDRIRDNDVDDHILMMVNCAPDGSIKSAQCTLTMIDEDSIFSPTVSFDTDGRIVQVNPNTKSITQRSETDIVQAFQNVLNETLKKSPGYNSFSDNRKQIPVAVGENLQWTRGGIKS